VTLVERITALVPALRRSAPEAEQARRIPAATLDMLDDTGVFRMMAPRRVGGEEADFDTQCRALAEVARGCPSASWVATIYSAMVWVASTYPDEAQDEVFAAGVPRIAGVFSPTGTAVRLDGGLLLNGRWPFNTGCHGAQWTVIVALVNTASGDPVPSCLLVRSAELTVLDDWYASGMAGTGSNTVVAKDVFVPAHRALLLPDMAEGQ
jgi:alkylation response protein AidB-like acyl-CoA dehydrogenase